MSCPHCRSESGSKRRRRTSLGYRIFFCSSCRRQFNERTGTPYNDLQFPVLWRLRYKLGFRDVAELLLQPGCSQSRDHTNVGVSLCASGHHQGFFSMEALIPFSGATLGVIWNLEIEPGPPPVDAYTTECTTVVID